MKENRGKEIAGEGKRPEGQAQDRPEGQTRPTAGDKRKFLPKNIDLEGLPVVETKGLNKARPWWSSPNLPSPSLPSR